MDADDAPSPNDAVLPWPSGTVHALDQVCDAELAKVLDKTLEATEVIQWRVKKEVNKH